MLIIIILFISGNLAHEYEFGDSDITKSVGVSYLRPWLSCTVVCCDCCSCDVKMFSMILSCEPVCCRHFFVLLTEKCIKNSSSDLLPLDYTALVKTKQQPWFQYWYRDT